MEVDKVNSGLGLQLGGGNKRYGIKIPDVSKKVADKELGSGGFGSVRLVRIEGEEFAVKRILFGR